MASTPGVRLAGVGLLLLGVGVGVGGIGGCAESPQATVTIVNDLAHTATYWPCDDFGCYQGVGIQVPPGARSRENLGDAGADYVVRVSGTKQQLCLHVAAAQQPRDIVVKTSSAEACREGQGPLLVVPGGQQADPVEPQRLTRSAADPVKVGVLRYRDGWRGSRIRVVYKETIPTGERPQRRIGELLDDVNAGRFDKAP